MPRKKAEKDKPPPNEETSFQKFQRLAKKLVTVPKEEIRQDKTDS